MNTRYGFYLDTSACTGCKACQIACKDKNNLPVGVLWRRVVEIQGGEWLRRGPAWLGNIFAYFLSSACMHCELPICAEVCPTRAITQRDDGIVLIDPDHCMGCRYCEMACPYKAPQFNPDLGVMTKCDFCADLIEKKKAPACVSACQMRVLHFGNLDELRAEHGSQDDIYPLPASDLTNPALVITPHRDALHGREHAARIGNWEEI
jgi:anaerobic dimethyl sulfoxide reductase subunit B